MIETTSSRGDSELEHIDSQTGFSPNLVKSLQRNHYINAINYANFEGESLQVIFKHKIYARNLTIQAFPSPCLNDSLELIWKGNIPDEDLSRFECTKILIPDRGGFLSAEPEDYCLIQGGMTIALPETAYILNNRQLSRSPGIEVDIQLIQNGCFYKGRLINFNPGAFLFTLETDNNPGLLWINRDETFQIILNKNVTTQHQP
ncbi:MAG: hypothetical protein JEY99_16070 [Spirochaetales bacterium]|nr:hypothetical protein [Spirochaetales bacterium]